MFEWVAELHTASKTYANGSREQLWTKKRNRMKKDAYYFSHDSNARDDENIVLLRMDMGWEGYGLFWAVVEMLREATDYQLQLDCKRIAFALQVHPDTIERIVKEFGLFENDGEFFWSESLKTRMAMRESVSGARRKAAQKRWDSAKAMQLQCKPDANAMQGKERKGNKKKGKQYSEEFERFWKAYPNKKAKGTAWESYKKADLPPISDLVNIVERQSKQDDWTKDNGKFIPMPSTWLNGCRWEDEITQQSETTNNSPAYQDVTGQRGF
jgi:hypothetical protein